MLRTCLLVLMSLGLLWGQSFPSEYDFASGPPPQIPANRVSAQVSGVAGSQTYYYWVVTTYPIGKSFPTGPVQVTSAPDTLSASNKVVVSWSGMPLALSYDVLRTRTQDNPSGVCNCAVSIGTTAMQVSDTSNTLAGYTVTVAPPASGYMRLNNRDYSIPTFDIWPKIIVGAASAINSGISLPTTCSVGDVYFLNTSLFGGQLYTCSTANFWSPTSNGDCNVKAYGAKGDGLTDDTVAIQNVINVCQGNTITFPIGTYLISDVLSIGNVGGAYNSTELRGENEYGSIISQVTPSKSAIQIGKSSYDSASISVHNLSLYAPASTSTATALVIQRGQHVDVRNIYFSNWLTGTVVTGLDSSHTSFFVNIQDCFYNNLGGATPASSYGIAEGWANDVWITRDYFISSSNPALQPYAAVYNSGTNGDYLEGIKTYEHGYGYFVTASAGNSTNNHFVRHCTFDSSTTVGSAAIALQPYTGGAILSTFIQNNWLSLISGSGTGLGISIGGQAGSTIDTVHIDGNIIQRCANGGIVTGANGTIHNLYIRDNTIVGNSEAVPGGAANVYLESAVIEADVVANRLGGTPNMAEDASYGLVIKNNPTPATEATRRFLVVGNSFKDNLSGPILDTTTTAIKVIQTNLPGDTTANQDLLAYSTAGAAPTASGRIAYDSTANRFVGGVNGGTHTFASVPLATPGISKVCTTVITALTVVNGIVTVLTCP